MNLKPGRALDALVAEKVMGWHQTIPGHWTNEATRQWSVDANHIPNYSSSIKAAWQVVEKLKRDGKRITFIDNDYSGFFEVCFSDAKISYGWCFSESAPHAICLAALNGCLRQGDSKSVAGGDILEPERDD